MINILFSEYNFNETWAAKEVGKYLRQGQKLVVLPFSFGPEVSTNQEWQAYYQPSVGRYYEDIRQPFEDFGIKERDTDIINYFTDSPDRMIQLIEESDVLFFTGGFPDLMMDRLIEKGLVETLGLYQGVIVGSSAGAMVQLGNYHISPDNDYPELVMTKGLNLVPDFDIEVHYEGAATQNKAIKFAQQTHGQKVYTISNQGGIISNASGDLTFVGAVQLFE